MLRRFFFVYLPRLKTILLSSFQGWSDLLFTILAISDLLITGSVAAISDGEFRDKIELKSSILPSNRKVGVVIGLILPVNRTVHVVKKSLPDGRLFVCFLLFL